MGNPGGELSEGGQFFLLYQLVLGRRQLFQRISEESIRFIQSLICNFFDFIVSIKDYSNDHHNNQQHQHSYNAVSGLYAFKSPFTFFLLKLLIEKVLLK